jgi:hypothetical protein
MCLELLIQTAEGAPGRIGAKRLSELSGLAVTPSRLDNKPALHISVSGGRSCEFPAKGAHKHQGVWEFDPMQIPKLTAAVRALNSEVRKYRLLARTDRLVNRRGDGHLHIFPTAQPAKKHIASGLQKDFCDSQPQSGGLRLAAEDRQRRGHGFQPVSNPCGAKSPTTQGIQY